MKKQALANFLNINVNEIEEADGVFYADGAEYLVLTEEEADEKAGEYIRDSLWAFNPDFILQHCKNYDDLDVYEYDAAIESLKETQSKQCESLNGLIYALIDDIDDFIADAINADGRGHFLSWYDGQEDESDGYFIYRIN